MILSDPSPLVRSQGYINLPAQVTKPKLTDRVKHIFKAIVAKNTGKYK